VNDTLKNSIIDHLGSRLTAIGFASVDRFDDAPEKHHPAKACKDAQTIIVLGITVPRGLLGSPDYNLHILHRSYHTVYKHLDELSLELSNFIEAQGDYAAVPIPSYAPMVFHGMEPWGVLSLKQAAACAGLGAFGRSEQVYHPQFGSLLRFSAVITNAELPGDPIIAEHPCPPKCTACHQVCPSKAYDAEGKFSKMTCLQYSIKHAIYPLALKDELGLKNIERVINTAGYNYWLACDECLKVCPINKPKKIRT
jgi:epoxyqueuosine reductase QueG